jgi:hypothetical protein
VAVKAGDIPLIVTVLGLPETSGALPKTIFGPVSAVALQVEVVPQNCSVGCFATTIFATAVVLVTVRGAVPVATVETRAGALRLLLLVTALVVVPATAGAVNVALPLVAPVRLKIPLEVPANPTVSVGAENVSWVLVAEACVPAVPRTKPPLAREATDVTQVAHPIAPAAEIVAGAVPLKPEVPMLPMGMAVGRSPVAIAE